MDKEFIDWLNNEIANAIDVSNGYIKIDDTYKPFVTKNNLLFVLSGQCGLVIYPDDDEETNVKDELFVATLVNDKETKKFKVLNDIAFNKSQIRHEENRCWKILSRFLEEHATPQYDSKGEQISWSLPYKNLEESK